MKQYFGIDIGGTAVKLGIVDETGKVLCKGEQSVNFDGYQTPVLDTVRKAAKEFLTAQSIPVENLSGIGVSATGQIDSRKGIVAGTCGNFPNYIGSPIKAALEQDFGLPVTVANDANCMTLGEVWVGGAQGYTDVIGVTLGTGVGGGIVVEGKLLHGAHGSGAEIGHLVLNRDETVPCNCGKRGCVEQYCSATGIVRLAKRHLDSTDAPSSLRTLKNLTCKDIFDAGKAGDKEALIILDRYYAYMGEFLGDVCTTVDPEVVVIGGGVSKAGQVLIDGILPYFHKYVFHAASGARFTLASLGNDAGAYGAFKLALDAFHA